MRSQDFPRDTSMRENVTGRPAKNAGGSPGDALTKASDIAQQAVDTAKQAVSDTTSSVIQQTKGLMDHQGNCPVEC